MTDAPTRLADLARPMQHAMNNFFMVLQANLEAVQASLPPEERNAVRVGRALQGAREMEALIRAYLRLGRPHEEGQVDSGRFLESVRPVLALAVAKPLKVEVLATAAIAPPRPEVDLALLDLAAGARALPPGTPLLRLDGNAIAVNWPAPEGVLETLAGLGLQASSQDGATRVVLG
ncbi:hypothetical protein CR162_10470 [Pseudoroseomonas rhizosphaerae]|uniref:Uncharacterized protein n=1 Tax=Teichococcus rhizosphaerae TaxID=1335062 RepID=A0A2C7ADG5_9PROT|nr:hypothetical protein [Pseudoroseomonas rhizosphaerae]PHK95156.1 hypothetical protein CR162_10470 [Pseudoroseomonas rhizosphaerae]